MKNGLDAMPVFLLDDLLRNFGVFGELCMQKFDNHFSNIKPKIDFKKEKL